ncbi:hypothetical protein BBN03_01275 [Vibrio parahaemolyticus]|nr:hypothetical protein BBN03_01275 [Vibrio parahaemolyticus]TOB62184.1 hypothetical protein CGK01_22845 [Vibrio parahaemolyticus]
MVQSLAFVIMAQWFASGGGVVHPLTRRYTIACIASYTLTGNSQNTLVVIMSYRDTSLWNDLNELRCLEAFKKLESEGFPRGKQSEYAREISLKSGLEVGNISAKICNYKSVAGINNESHASVNTRDFYNKYKSYSISEIHDLVKSLE